MTHREQHTELLSDREEPRKALCVWCHAVKARREIKEGKHGLPEESGEESGGEDT